MKVKDLVKDLLNQNQDADVVVVKGDNVHAVGWMKLQCGKIGIQIGSRLDIYTKAMAQREEP